MDGNHNADLGLLPLPLVPGMGGEGVAPAGLLFPEVLFISSNLAKAGELTYTYTHVCTDTRAQTHTCNAFSIYNTTTKQAFSLFRTQENQEVGHEGP